MLAAEGLAFRLRSNLSGPPSFAAFPIDAGEAEAPRATRSRTIDALVGPFRASRLTRSSPARLTDHGVIAGRQLSREDTIGVMLAGLDL